jgi:aerobic carbon-monoxide dehydrogenase medium subunit
MDYVRPSTLEQARTSLEHRVEAKLLAGGQSLLPSMRMGLAAPDCLVDLQDLTGLRTIELSGGILRIGAMATHASIAQHQLVQTWAPFLERLAKGIGDQQVRHMGTIGGSLANNDPAACWPAGVLAADARIVTTQGVHRADDYFVDLFVTALAPNEIITCIEFDVSKGPLVGAYEKFEQLASRFALTGVALTRAAQGVRVAITGLGGGVRRWPQAEQALANDYRLESLQGLTLESHLAYDDMHASARYRAHLASVLTKRCVNTLTQ